MKTYLLSIACLIIIQFAYPVFAQKAKNTFVLSEILTHYENIHWQNEIGFFGYPVDPGIEVMYFRNFGKNISLEQDSVFKKGEYQILLTT